VPLHKKTNQVLLFGSAFKKQVGGDHYMKRTAQPVHYAQANDFGYCESNALKYLTRHRQPTGKGREDLEKAMHSIEMAISIYYEDEHR